MDTSAVPPTMDAMQTKKTATGVASEASAQAALRRGPTSELAPDEERVLRMRLGASPPRTASLERTAERSDLEIELLAAEIEAHLRWREHQATVSSSIRAVPQPSRTKEKIVRALRKKV
jgi:hypothetical protein